MRVAMFTDTYLPQINGVTNTLSQLEKYFSARGVDYRILAPEYDATEQRERVNTFASFRLFMYPECRLSLVNQGRVQAIMKDFRPDVVHLATEFNMGWAGLKYAATERVPVISTFTTNFPQYLQHYKLDILTDVMWEYLRWYHNQCDLTVCPSHDTRNLLISQGIPKTLLWGRGIDTDSFSPSQRSGALRKQYLPQGGKLLLYVGRLSPEKDLPVLLEAYRSIGSSSGERTALVIVGGGPLREELESRYGAEDIFFVGYKQGASLSELYASADIFVFPSGTETLGNVVLEAMASGLPVIGVSAGGVLENIRHEKNGLLCTPGSTEDFRKGIQRLMEHPELIKALGEEGIRHARSKSWDSVFDELMGHYQRVVKDRKISAA